MRKAIIFACDKEFLPYTIFAINRIRSIDPDLDCDFCICSGTISKEDYPFSDEGILFHSIDLSPVNKLKTVTRFPVSTYIRLLLPDYFQNDYDRILYLDGDTYLRKPGLDKLLNLEMDGHAIAASLEAQTIAAMNDIRGKSPVDASYREQLGMNEAKYLNSGVLLIDVHQFRRQKIFTRVVEYASANPEKLRYMDQSTLNAILKGDWLQLSGRWNFQRVRDADLIEDEYDPTIIHFCGPKPWEDTKFDWPNSYRDEYAAFLSTHFPEFRIKRKVEIVKKFTWLEKFKRQRRRNEMLTQLKQFEANCKI